MSETRIKYWLPVILYAILIFLVSSIPGSQVPAFFAYQDGVVHVLEYALLAVLVLRAAKVSFPGRRPWVRAAGVFLGCLLYAATDEFHQRFVPLRYCSAVDLLWDGIGILLPLTVCR